MLKQILSEFQQARTPLCLDELSRKLEIEASALEGMLQTLVQNGRLQEIGPVDDSCIACPARGGCVIMANGVQKSYFLKIRHESTAARSLSVGHPQE